MLVAVLAGQCDVAGERRRQSAHEPAIPRVPRFVALRGQIGRMREMIGNRVLVTPIYPTVEAGLLGTVGSVKTRERDRYLRFCELYGTSGDRVTTAESRMLWARRWVLAQAAGRLASQASMSLRRQPTARAPSWTGRGNSSRRIIS